MRASTYITVELPTPLADLFEDITRVVHQFDSPTLARAEYRPVDQREGSRAELMLQITGEIREAEEAF